MNVVFVLSDYVLHNRIVSDYVSARPEDRVAIVKVPLVLKGKGRFETALRIAPQLSRRFLLGKILEGLVLAAITVLPKVMRRGAVFRRLRTLARRHRLPYLRTSNVMSEEALGFVRAQRPDVVVTLFHQIVKRPLLDLPRLGVVNIHPGLLPEFRGIQPYFWEARRAPRARGRDAPPDRGRDDRHRPRARPLRVRDVAQDVGPAQLLPRGTGRRAPPAPLPRRAAASRPRRSRAAAAITAGPTAPRSTGSKPRATSSSRGGSYGRSSRGATTRSPRRRPSRPPRSRTRDCARAATTGPTNPAAAAEASFPRRLCRPPWARRAAPSPATRPP